MMTAWPHQGAIGAFELLAIRRAAHAEHLVVITRGAGHQRGAAHRAKRKGRPHRCLMTHALAEREGLRAVLA
jgi:hypothetical protein